MRLREWLVGKIAESWGIDVFAYFFAIIGTFLLAIFDKPYWPMLAVALFFLGFYCARQIYTPREDKPNIGLTPMTRDEFDEYVRGRR